MTIPPIEIDPAESAEVIPLGAKYRAPPSQEDRTLTIHMPNQCLHMNGYELDESLEHVHCRACKQALNPMWVLQRLAYKETKYHTMAERYQDMLAKIGEKNRCKCQHCGKMTKIDRMSV